MEIIRATTTAGRAGEDVRSASAGQWTMENGQWTMENGQWTTLEVEFDEHDTPETKYIVAVDEYLPIATCRLYSINDARVMLGRILLNYFRKLNNDLI
ncbi:MAG: hypothetical protein J6W75_02445 [Bacteroidaceae bacterium]|nr:hypothetical protein [Bacteroidaceae bacterium]